MSTIGLRLKKERVRLGFPQEKFAELCGVKKGSQINYEQDKRKPDTHYLVKADALGVDIPYVLTGKKKTIDELAKDNSVQGLVFSEIDKAELIAMVTRIATALSSAELDVKDEVLVSKMMPVYIQLSSEQAYNSRDAIGKQSFDNMLKLFANQLA